MVEAPVQITDEYVRTYLWEHNLVAIDEGDLRKLMQPTKLLAIPALMEQAGWVRKKDWVGLTAKDLVEIPPSCYEGAIWADARLKEKNT